MRSKTPSTIILLSQLTDLEDKSFLSRRILVISEPRFLQSHLQVLPLVSLLEKVSKKLRAEAEDFMEAVD